ncbi:NADH/ubiquinone/plastoquinone (complex I) [Ectothiorhodospiraceae bacterium 2226]|nr:NADH/ubiquinone/plastoquinone (complex I) [Ectothiorhodospiraceae bacterium 2226]
MSGAAWWHGGEPWLVLLLVIPLAGALLCFAHANWARAVALGAATLTAVAAVFLSAAVARTGSVAYAVGAWPAPLGIQWHVDPLGVWMLLLSAAVGWAGVVYALGYYSPRGEHTAGSRQARFFWPLWLFLWASLNAMFMSADLFNLYLALELTGLAAVGLTALPGVDQALRAAMRYFLASLLGSLAYLLGVALLYGRYGVLDIGLLGERFVLDWPGVLAAALITLALLLKSAIFPLHFWLPAAHGRAPTPVSAVLSAVVVAATFYLLVRLWFGPLDALLRTPAANLLGALGAVAIVWGAMQALRQRRLKMLIAYSTVSQLGYGMLLFPLAAAGAEAGLAWSGALLVVFAHGLAKAGLFFAAGCIALHYGHDRIERLLGMWGSVAWAWLAFALASASLVGLPPSGGFAGKWLMLQAAIATEAWLWAGVIVAGTLLTALYLFRILERALRPGPRVREVRPLPAPMLALAVIPAAGAFLLGLFMAPLGDLLTLDAPYGSGGP